MKHFEYKVLIDDVNTHQARLWCKENFGKQSIIPLRYKSKKPYIQYSQYMVYDLENNRWHHTANKTQKTNPRAFYFKNSTDAMAFKLRWL